MDGTARSRRHSKPRFRAQCGGKITGSRCCCRLSHTKRLSASEWVSGASCNRTQMNLAAASIHWFAESTGILDPLPLTAPRRGRRTALTFRLFPPPQKNCSPPSDSSPGTFTPGGISRLSRGSPVRTTVGSDLGHAEGMLIEIDCIACRPVKAGKRQPPSSKKKATP